MSSLFLHATVFITLASVPVLAQTIVLPYRPIKADYSKALNRLVLIAAAPNALHVYDPLLKKDVAVRLEKPPLSLSLSPSGRKAAVGHEGLISYVDLSNSTVQKTFRIPISAGSVVLSQTWVYAMPMNGNDAASISLASGAVTRHYFREGTGGRLDPAVNAIYGTRDDTNPNDLVKYDISSGPITAQTDSPYHGDYCIWGPVWVSGDGSRIYNRCGSVLRASKDPKLDMYYTTSFAGIRSIGSLTESTASQRIALVQEPVYPDFNAPDDRVLLFDSTYLKQVAQFILPPFVVKQRKYQAHGKSVFFNAESTALFVLMQADYTSGLVNDFALYRIPLSNAPPACGALFNTASIVVPAQGSKEAVDIIATPSCRYQVSTRTPWIQIVGGGYGSGDGTLTLIARPNSGKAVRNGTLSLGARTLSVRQSGATTPALVQRLGYSVVSAAYAKSLDKLVLTTTQPDELHIYNPADASEKIVPLALPPLSLSIRPDGTFAAVGHDGWVSYLNLTTGAVQKLFPVTTDAQRVVLASNGLMYLFPKNDWSDLYSLQISTGSATATHSGYKGQEPRLHASGKYMYVGGYSYSKWDISQGVAQVVYDGGIIESCGNLWLTLDGRYALTACATVYTTSETYQQDGQLVTSLPGASFLQWADHSIQRRATAAIPFWYEPGTEVQIHGDQAFELQGTIPLPEFVVDGTAHPSRGRFVFWNNASSALYVVVQADVPTDQTSSWGVVKLTPPPK